MTGKNDVLNTNPLTIDDVLGCLNVPSLSAPVQEQGFMLTVNDLARKALYHDTSLVGVVKRTRHTPDYMPMLWNAVVRAINPVLKGNGIFNAEYREALSGIQRNLYATTRYGIDDAQDEALVMNQKYDREHAKPRNRV